MIVGYVFFWALVFSMILRGIAEVADNALFECPHCGRDRFRKSRCSHCGTID